MDRNVHLMGGEYLEKYKPELSASGTDHALKYARGNTPTILMSGARDMNLAHIYRQAAIPNAPHCSVRVLKGIIAQLTCSAGADPKGLGMKHSEPQGYMDSLSAQAILSNT